MSHAVSGSEALDSRSTIRGQEISANQFKCPYIAIACFLPVLRVTKMVHIVTMQY